MHGREEKRLQPLHPVIYLDNLKSKQIHCRKEGEILEEEIDE